ncbi:hypothetical protein F2P56_012349 [Juglans regia]|uniref:Uncharacterized protein LOC108994255 n=2 Tax=Juglans regia TaxID=51240 RepID=A0A2I4EZV8_JUGRE|nr:uncharacterized protein LOC108994255 [Juglans regia]KAF5468173.1 hypothetical protein F2P56_012349 [Juglans regia]
MERKEANRSHVRGSASDPVEGGEKKLGIQNDGEFNWSAGSKDHETENDTYISKYAETTGHDESDELMKQLADLETGNKRVPATFPKQTRKQRRSKHERCPSLENIVYLMMCCEPEGELPFLEPNPGIKRPPVTVFQPLPPPPPPTL